MDICPQHGPPPILVVIAAALTLLIAALSLRGREDKAPESLQWLRGEETNVRQEWNTIQVNVRRQKGPSFSAASGAAEDGMSKTPILRQKRLLRPVLTTCGMMLFLHMSGAHAFNFYAVLIFRTSFAGMDPYGAAIV